MSLSWLGGYWERRVNRPATYIACQGQFTSGLEAKVPLIELMNSPNIEHLAGRIASKSGLVNRGLFEAGDGEVAVEKNQ